MRLMEYFIGYLCVAILQQGLMPKTFFVDQLLHIYLGVLVVDFILNTWMKQKITIDLNRR